MNTESPRRNVSKPTRNGCRTCRIRKVKCDETRPACHRCVSTGRACDGDIGSASSSYTRQRPLLPAATSTSTGLQPLQVTTRTSTAATSHRLHSSLLVGNTISLLQNIACSLSDQERRGFEHFREFTGPALQAILPSPDWISVALQLSCREPSVFHAISATGNMARALTVLIHPSFPRPVIQQPTIDATRQYGKAMRLLRDYMKTTTSAGLVTETILLVCLLFVCFEAFRGQNSAAAQHAYLGWNVAKSRAPLTQMESSPSARFFTSIFSQSIGVSAFFVDKQHHDTDDCCSSLSELASSLFSTWNDATKQLLVLARAGDHLRAEFLGLAKTRMSSVMNLDKRSDGFCFCLAACLSRTITISVTQERQLQQLRQAHCEWKDALLVHEEAFKRRDLKTYLILRIKHFYSSFTLATCRDVEETATENLANDFADALNTIDAYIAEERSTSSSSTQRKRNIRFFGTSILPSLDVIAHKCRHPQLRYRAIDLLSRIRKLEGLEDSQALGKYARAVAEVEESIARGMTGIKEPSMLPLEARFSDVVTIGQGARGIFKLICARYTNVEPGEREIEVMEYEAGSVSLRLCSAQRISV